jgi:hypothetical protein
MRVKKMLVKPSIATGLYPNLAVDDNQVKTNRIDGWAPQRSQWGEVDHRARGFVSPLGGTVTVKLQTKKGK